MPRFKGKFWPYVRPLIWEKAQQLFQEEEARTMGSDFNAITATKRELREGSYFHRAKIIVLSNLYRQKKGLPTVEEEAVMHGFVQTKTHSQDPASPENTDTPNT